jgi:environmental stress-induced protein Ves
VRILRAEQHRAMRWKNGGGITYEIASFPPADQALDGFDWRVSMALVETDGPFSLFPGIDRTLAIVSGAGLRLTVGDAPEVAIEPHSEPHSFAADVPTDSRLIDGPVTDLNVMTRRGVWRHRVARIDVAGTQHVDELADVTLLIVRSGQVSMFGETLNAKDAVVLDGATTIESANAADVFRIDMWRM